MNNEPKKYQAYLQEGFDLLEMNYSLLSYISALGAYRYKMTQLQQTTEFLADFYPVAKRFYIRWKILKSFVLRFLPNYKVILSKA